LKNISYRPTYILGWVRRKYYSNTIDKEWFNIYSGMNGSLGNILQTQLTINGSTYILEWMIVNCVWRIFPTDPSTP
jgi:hypothetical protein